MNPINNSAEKKKQNGSRSMKKEKCFERLGPSPDCISEVFSDIGHADFISTDHDTATEYSIVIARMMVKKSK